MRRVSRLHTLFFWPFLPVFSFVTVTVAIVALENLFFYFYFLPYRIIFSYATIATIKKNIEIIKEIISTDRHSVLLSNSFRVHRIWTYHPDLSTADIMKAAVREAGDIITLRAGEILRRKGKWRI